MIGRVISIGIPLLILALYVALVFFIRGKLPDTETLLSHIEELYGRFGYPLIFVAAIMESTFLLGFYLPGSAVVLFGAALAQKGILAFPVVYVLGTFGFLCGFVINYFLGKHGWYHVLSQLGFEKGIDEAKEKLTKHGIKSIFLGYFFPSSASFFSTAAGILRMPFKKFLLASIFAQSLWSIFWGILAFFFGVPLVEFILKNFVFVVFALIIYWFGKRYFKKKTPKKAS